MRQPFLVVFLLVALLTGVLPAAPRRSRPGRWVGAWAASQQVPEPANALSPDDLRDATLRQIVHLTAGGSRLRVHLSNAFGSAPLRIDAVHIALALSPATGGIDPATDRALSFAGQAGVTIPAGAEYISDPVDWPLPPLANLAVTLYLAAPPVGETGHPGSRETSFLAHGDQVSAAVLRDAKPVEHWYFLSAVDVLAAPAARAIVALGDSITDGHGATLNGNDRWPDDLAARLQAAPATRMLSVLNLGTGGNRLLLDGLGPNALARFDRDVLAQSGARYLIVLEGINDLGTLTRQREVPAAAHQALVRQIIGAYRQIILRAHAHGLAVMGATITPDVGSSYYHPGPAAEADRQAINAWIRAAGHFDAVVDFDQIVRDPAQPERLRPAFDSGDHLHPSPAGYRAMAEAIPLAFFAPRRAARAAANHASR